MQICNYTIPNNNDFSNLSAQYKLKSKIIFYKFIYHFEDENITNLKSF